MRINDQIRAAEVRLIDEKGEQLGVVSLQEALKKADEAGFDLVEVSPTAKPPVCRIIDYGKFLYQKEKKLKEARKKQKTVEIKEMKFTPRIDKHDFDYRIKRVREFIAKGDKVKITIRFRGREMAHTELGFDVIKRVKEEVKDICQIEKPSKLEGRNITMVIVPLKT